MQQYYGQSQEDKYILEYFGNRKVSILSIGENSGQHLSNVRALILNGSYGTLVEPSPVFFKLSEMYLDREDVFCINVAVSNFIGKSKFYDSATHLNKGDNSLLSSLNKEEISKWMPTTKFNEITVDVVDFKTLLNLSPYKHFSFISIDCEGEDIKILKQMDLKELECECICIEFNSNPEILKEIETYCSGFGLSRLLLKNAENVIFVK